MSAAANAALEFVASLIAGKDTMTVESLTPPQPIPAPVPVPVGPRVRPVGRRVVTAEEVDAPLPQVALLMRPYTPLVLLEAEIARLTQEVGMPMDLKSINDRVGERARTRPNIANAKRKIKEWEARDVELQSALPFDEFARDLYAQAQTTNQIDRQRAAGAARRANLAREKKARMEVEGEQEED